MNHKKKVMIAMSGGVDSSVAAYLMQKEGYECMGATMKLYDKACGAADDAKDAAKVAEAFSMPFELLDFTDAFDAAVIKRFVNTYMEGGTPNPCIECNRYLKFHRLMQRMQELDYDYVATGHYARIEYCEESGRYLLKKGIDESKDQSYVLYNLTQEQLAHTLFPLGNYHKTEIRQMAEEMGFVNADKPDSQDICFVPDGDYAAFIESYCGKTFEEGDFVTEDGKVLGRHKGIIRYTIGQRKGLGLALPEPMYVCQKCMDTNTVVLGRNEDLFHTTLEADELNWIAFEDVTYPVRCKAKIRYKQKEADATIEKIGEDRVRVCFDEPQRGITTGQAVVFYDGDKVLGGGKIK